MSRMPLAVRIVLGLVALVAVVFIGLFAGSLVEARWLRWTVRAVVWLIGAFILFLSYRLMKGSPGAKASAQPDVIDDQMVQARKALAAAGAPARGAVEKLPLVLLMGPKGSAKSTFVMQSGLESEHLVGRLRSGQAVAPTDALNVWYHQGHLLVEAGGQIVAEPDRWARVVRRVRPAKWIPALLRRPQAPRVAIVCVSMEELARPGAMESAMATATNLRDRLAELSESIGIRLPVYVVFTKSDAIPHFTEYVEKLTDADVHEVLGTTLRALGEAPAGAHKERQSVRLKAAFDALYQSLAERRLEVLSRAGATPGSGACYEFPREFRKVSVLATQFLVELCRPSQLGVSPFLRGFYFTGVRPIEVAGDQPVQVIANRDPQAPAGATQIFSAQQLQQHRPQQPAPAQRRVPQWVFLDRILKTVVFPDRVAMGMTTGGFGLAVLRRASLAFALVAVLVVGGGVLIGLTRDRRLLADTRAAISAVENIRAPDPALADQADLERLDQLRAATQRLSSYENGLAPLRKLAWLYSGGELYPMARRAYFDRFEKLLLNRARRGVTATLADLPDAPTLDERESVYDALKAHVEMTDYSEEADASFFGRVLSAHWAGINQPAEPVQALARAQFAFYGAELPYGNPFPGPANDLMVNTARAFLSDNTSEDSFYQGLLSQSNRHPSFALNRDLPGTEGFISNSYEVPGAFTNAGWSEVTAALASAEQFFSRDPHVVGNEFYRNLENRGFDLDAMALTLRQRYERDYIAAWSDFLQSATVVIPQLAQASTRLQTYGGNQSALFRMLTVVNENTRDKTAAFDTIFGAVRMLTAPDSVSQNFSEQHGMPYLLTLQALGQATVGFSDNPGSAAAQDALRGAATDGVGLVGGVEVGFPTTPREALQVSAAVGELLRSPFEWARGLVGRGAVLAANRAASAFCSQQAGVLSQYPFATSASPAPWRDVHAFFNPESGAVFEFFDEAEALGPLNATYENFKSRVTLFVQSVYRPGDASPNFRILLSFDVADTVDVNIDGVQATFTPTERRGQPLEWRAATAQEATLRLRGNRSEGLEWSGTWAIFRLFHQASWDPAAAGASRVVWRLPNGQSVSGTVTHESEGILDPDYFRGFGCPTSIAR